MAMTGLLGIIVLGCGGLLSITAVAVVVYLFVTQREK